jgi:hypothetical protein
MKAAIRKLKISARSALVLWLQRRRRARAGGGKDGAPPAPGVNDLAVVYRHAEGFLVEWTALPDLLYRVYYRIHGESGWSAIWDGSDGTTDLEIVGATGQAFDLKVTARGDGVTYSAAEVDSNIVTTVNDSALLTLPVSSLYVLALQDDWVVLNWDVPGVAPGSSVDFWAYFREEGPGPWLQASGGDVTDGAVMVEGLSPGTTYEFKLETFGTGNQNVYSIVPVDSNVVSAEVPGEPPAAPEGLDWSFDEATVTFTWNDMGADSYVVQICLSGDGFQTLVYNFSTSEPGTDGLPINPNFAYDVRVKAVLGTLESDWTEGTFILEE